MKRLLFACAVMCLALNALAQDPQLSQYYAAPLYLNPAFTGNLDFDCRKLPSSRFRFIGNYRNQYGGNFNTTMVSGDYRSKNGEWGFGILAYQDRIGETPLTQQNVSGLASYKIGITNDWRLHSGLQVGYGARNTSLDAFTYPDQYTSAGLTRATNEGVARGGSVDYVDVSAGLLVFNEAFYFGTAAHHLNQPTASLLEGTEKLPIRFSAHTGYRIAFKKGKGFVRKGADRSVTPTIHYKRQAQFHQLDVGTYFNYEPLVVGAWFRGIPIDKAPNSSFQRDAVVLLVGIRQATDYGLFKLGLSYDFPISTEGSTIGRTFELSLSYQLIDERCRKRISYRSIPCPGI